MSHHPRSIIETLAEAIKGYFSICGLVVLGIYLVKSPDMAPFGVAAISYLGGISAVVIGSVVGVWYYVHLVRSIYTLRDLGSAGRRGEKLVFSLFLLLSSFVLVSLIASGLKMTCSQML